MIKSRLRYPRIIRRSRKQSQLSSFVTTCSFYHVNAATLKYLSELLYSNACRYYALALCPLEGAKKQFHFSFLCHKNSSNIQTRFFMFLFHIQKVLIIA